MKLRVQGRKSGTHAEESRNIAARDCASHLLNKHTAAANQAARECEMWRQVYRFWLFKDGIKHRNIFCF